MGYTPAHNQGLPLLESSANRLAEPAGLDLVGLPEHYEIEMPITASNDVGLLIDSYANCEGYGYGFNY